MTSQTVEDEIPFSGDYPIIFLELSADHQVIGNLHIRLDRNVFPNGVENFVGLAVGNTEKTEETGVGPYKLIKKIRRSLEGSKVFNFSHNNYIVTGDIYSNTGDTAGTIYDDEPIPEFLQDYFYTHAKKGAVSLVSYRDQDGKLYYDSIFMITLSDDDSLLKLDESQIVIGHVTNGLSILDKINKMLEPFPEKKYPIIRITRSGILGKYGDDRFFPIVKMAIEKRNQSGTRRGRARK